MAEVTITASAGDGQIQSWNDSGGGSSAANWANAQNGSNESALPTSTTAKARLDAGPAFAYDNYIYRVLLPFSLSSLPTGATVTAATLRVYVASKTVGEGDSIRVTKTTQGSLTTISAASDWDAISDTSYADATYPTLSGISTSAYLEIALNAAALADISPGGSFKCALRLHADVAETGYPTNAGFGGGYPNDRDVTINTSEAASNKPELVITYTLPAGPLPTSRRIPRGLYAR